MRPSKKILIIDDEIDLCLLLRDYFVKKNYDVSVSHTLGEGRELLDKSEPDVLFLDNNLPDGTGWNIAPDISAAHPDMYVVLISAFHPHVPDMPFNVNFRIIERPISMADLDKQFSEF